jgi:hypothetical protein
MLGGNEIIKCSTRATGKLKSIFILFGAKPMSNDQVAGVEPRSFPSSINQEESPTTKSPKKILKKPLKKVAEKR